MVSPYLQHPGTTHLEETLHAAMYWKGLQHSVGTHVKSAIDAKSTKDASKSTVNYLQS